MQVAFLNGEFFITKSCDVIGLINVHEKKLEVLNELREFCLVQTLLQLLQEDLDTLTL